MNRVACFLVGAGIAAAVAPPVTPAHPAPNAEPVEVTVYAAASLRDALQAIATVCEPLAGARLVFNFGASNDLARQIVAADKADLFFSADEAQMDKVASEGLLDAASRVDLLSNRLAVVVPPDSKIALRSAADLAGVNRLALADPDAVPAGKYAKAWLEKAGVWEKVAAKVAPFPDVRAALAAVEAGSVEAGIVYMTDVPIGHQAKLAFEVPESEAVHISYPLAVLKDRPALETARRVAACFASSDARQVFVHFGFRTIAAASGSKP
ncbi:MAG TPA: molybdate ABC transporter substrate-binding protein [Candidatus Polarisedimenticolia bacterium]|jgi:molybdate transport system substrate-binding protein|nr:molybdate ABC transporter substrate-binding protein [Candidatus Polarisedimenticolia bacterium]